MDIGLLSRAFSVCLSAFHPVLFSLRLDREGMLDLLAQPCLFVLCSQSKCPSTDKREMKMWCIYMTEFYPAVTKNKS